MTDIELAHLLADAADVITLSAYVSDDLLVSTKPDGSVVTRADWEAEDEIRRLVTEYAPFDGVLGEERGRQGGDVRRWIVDPVDGTSSFASGHPEWATMLALEVAEVLEAAVVSSPALARRWWATRGGGAWGEPLPREPVDPSPMKVSMVDTPGMARVAVWPPSERLTGPHAELARAFREVAAAAAGDLRGAHVKPTRDTGFPNASVLVAAGALDGFLLSGGGPWDLAAPALLVEEAGGRFSDLAGGRSLGTGAGLFTNGALHDDLLGWCHA